MEYVFGTEGEIEVLKTKGAAHTNLTGYIQTVREFPGEKITDNFRIARKISSSEDSEGNCYDWYEIDRHYREIDRTGPIAESLNNAAQVSSIAFVVMAERGDIDEVTAAEHADQFAEWAFPVDYKAGQIRRYADGKLYKCLKDHTSQEDWAPPAAVSLWVAVADPAEEWPEWSQPLGAHDAYNAGDKVSHNGKHWTSDVDGNVWEPGTYGWTVNE